MSVHFKTNQVSLKILQREHEKFKDLLNHCFSDLHSTVEDVLHYSSSEYVEIQSAI